MSHNIFFSNKAGKQYRNLDLHIRNKIKTELQELKDNPWIGLLLSGKYSGLRYIKIIYKRVEYRIVYDISEEKKEILIIFLGTRENFYKELRRYLS